MRNLIRDSGLVIADLRRNASRSIDTFKLTRKLHLLTASGVLLNAECFMLTEIISVAYYDAKYA